MSGLTNTDNPNELRIDIIDKSVEKYRAKRSTNIHVYDKEALLTSSMFSKELMSTVKAQKLSRKNNIFTSSLDTIFVIQLTHAISFAITAFMFALSTTQHDQKRSMRNLLCSFIILFILDLFMLRVCVFMVIHRKLNHLVSMIFVCMLVALMAFIFMLSICFIGKNVILSYDLGFGQVLFWYQLILD